MYHSSVPQGRQKAVQDEAIMQSSRLRHHIHRDIKTHRLMHHETMLYLGIKHCKNDYKRTCAPAVLAAPAAPVAGLQHRPSTAFCRVT
jgi:hypothetical protein